MSSDKQQTNVPATKPSSDSSNQPYTINPANFDYSLIKNYFPNQSFPQQSYMNYPMDMSAYQQPQSAYQSNPYSSKITYINKSVF